MKVYKVGCHKKVLVVLWGHIESFGWVKFMVIARDLRLNQNDDAVERYIIYSARWSNKEPS
jgi:hypothetical protein